MGIHAMCPTVGRSMVTFLDYYAAARAASASCRQEK